MPPPMVVCSICQKNVMKAQTYHVGDGKRACKEHEGVNQAKVKLEQEAIEKKKRDEQTRQIQQDQRDRDYHPPLEPHCMDCKERAIYEQDVYKIMAITNKKMELMGKELFCKEFKEEVDRKIDGRTIVTLYTKEGNEKAFGKLPMMLSMASMFGFIGLCKSCAAKYGVKAPEKPDITLDQMVMFGAAVEPVVRAQAMAELAKDAQKN